MNLKKEIKNKIKDKKKFVHFSNSIKIKQQEVKENEIYNENNINDEIVTFDKTNDFIDLSKKHHHSSFTASILQTIITQNNTSDNNFQSISHHHYLLIIIIKIIYLIIIIIIIIRLN